MRPLAATLTLLVLACGGVAGQPSVDPGGQTPPKSAEATPPTKPKLALQVAGTHCDAHQLAWVHCEIGEGQTLSVCSDNPMTPTAAVQVRTGVLGHPTGWPSTPGPMGQGWSWAMSEVPFTGPSGPPAGLTATLSGAGWSLVETESGAVWTQGEQVSACQKAKGELANLADYLDRD